MDSISNLPDEVLGKILSLLPTKVASSTSVLSKRWRNLLPLVDELDFDESMRFYFYPLRSRLGESKTFSDFVDKTLAFSSPIKRFSLKCDHEDSSRVNRWIRTALERGCFELNLVYSRIQLLVDSALFNSNKIVKLTISDRFLLDGGGDVFLPSLKTLSLSSFFFDMVKFFINGCPALEELFICVVLGYSSGLKLKTPSLVYLDDSLCDYRLAFDSLVKARLDLRLYESYRYDVQSWKEIHGNVTSLVNGISDIKTLHLSPYSLEVFSLCSMPVLYDLLTLSIASDELKGWQVLPHLLDNSPNLQTLVIKGLVHRVTDWCGDACACIRMKNKEKVCCLSRCRVKVLEISGYRGSFKELKQMRHFLGKLKYLETVKVVIEEDMKNLRANVMALPRASSKCNIQFILLYPYLSL